MDYPGPDILAFTSNQRKIGSTVFGKNTVVMSAGQTTNENEFSAILDRSPCGSGTAAIMVNLHHKKILGKNNFFQQKVFSRLIKLDETIFKKNFVFEANKFNLTMQFKFLQLFF